MSILKSVKHNKSENTYTLSKKDYGHLTTLAEIGENPFPFGRMAILAAGILLMGVVLGVIILSSLSPSQSLGEMLTAQEEELTLEERSGQILVDYNELMVEVSQGHLTELSDGDITIVAMRGPGVFEVYSESVGACFVIIAFYKDDEWTTMGVTEGPYSVTCIN